MAEPAAIAAARSSCCSGAPSLAGERVLVTAGGTREPHRRGARRSATAPRARWASRSPPRPRGAAPRWCWSRAPSALPTPPGVRRVDVESALEMRDAVLAELAARRRSWSRRPRWPTSGPRAPSPGKIKQGGSAPRAPGSRSSSCAIPDILAEICRDKGARRRGRLRRRERRRGRGRAPQARAQGLRPDRRQRRLARRTRASTATATRSSFVWPGGERRGAAARSPRTRWPRSCSTASRSCAGRAGERARRRRRRARRSRSPLGARRVEPALRAAGARERRHASPARSIRPPPTISSRRSRRARPTARSRC